VAAGDDDFTPLTPDELAALRDADLSEDPVTLRILRTLHRAHASGLVYGGDTHELDPSGWTKSTLPAVAVMIALEVEHGAE
jgi:hypothetical protein